MSAKTGNAASTFDLVANETLNIISNLLADSPRALTTFMRLCRRTAEIGARIRYSSLYIRGFQGQCLLATLVSGTPLSNKYCLLVKRLWLQGLVCTELELIATLLSQALYLMDNLVAFAAEALPIDCTHLLRSMRREGLIRDSSHPSLAVTVSEGSPERYSLYTLPRLRTMMLNGDPTLLRAAAYRPLTELIVDYILSGSDWATFMTMTDGSILGFSLKTLWIKFGRGVDLQLAIPVLSRTFPNLAVLALTRGGLAIADLLNDFGREGLQFANLGCLWLNPNYGYSRLQGTALTVEAELSPDALRERFLNITRCRALLQTVAIGSNVWTIGDSGEFALREPGDQESQEMASLFGRQLRPYFFHDMPNKIDHAMNFTSWNWRPLADM